MLHAYRKNLIAPAELAEQACAIEIDRLGELIGKQGQYIAAIGGITAFTFHPDGRVEYRPARLAEETLFNLEDMLRDATRNYEQPLTEERLLGWQAALFPAGRSGIRRILVGQWRTPEMDPVTVVSGPIDGDRIRRKYIHFEAPNADRLPGEVSVFLQWFESGDRTDPVLRAGIAHFWFVTIRPFEDGNGRVSRAIADMALARSEGSAQRFYGMSTQIEHEKQDYDRALETAQKGSLDITGWFEWFIGCFSRAVGGASLSVARIVRKTGRWEQFNRMVEPNERERKVLNALLDAAEEEVSTSKSAELAGTSLDTALRDIRQLIEAGVLRPGSGGGRSTKYLLASAAPDTLKGR